MGRSHVGEEQRIVAGAPRALDARARLWHKLRILFREWRGCKLQENVVLNPLLKVAQG